MYHSIETMDTERIVVSYRRIIARDQNPEIYRAVHAFTGYVMDTYGERRNNFVIEIIQRDYGISIESVDRKKRSCQWRYRVTWPSRKNFVWFMLEWQRAHNDHGIEIY